MYCMPTVTNLRKSCYNTLQTVMSNTRVHLHKLSRVKLRQVKTKSNVKGCKRLSFQWSLQSCFSTVYILPFAADTDSTATVRFPSSPAQLGRQTAGWSSGEKCALSDGCCRARRPVFATAINTTTVTMVTVNHSTMEPHAATILE